MSRKKVIAVIALAIVAAPLAAVADRPFDQPIDRIVGFGDSLSDPGNMYALTGMQSHAPYDPVPTWPYAIGDNHYSNGPTWLEQMAESLRRPLSGQAAFTRGRPYSNYAVGGARAGPGGEAPGLSEQVAVFLSHNPGNSLPSSLVVIEFGSNDIRAALLAAAAGDAAGAAAAIQAGIESTSHNIQSLYLAGARRFLIVSPPNLAVTPAILALGEPAISTTDQLSRHYVAGLHLMLDGLEAAFADIRFARLDLAVLVETVVSDPEAYGLTELFTPCLRFFVIDEPVCDEPDEHLFWDALHPTTAVHGILADAAIELLNLEWPRERDREMDRQDSRQLHGRYRAHGWSPQRNLLTVQNWQPASDWRPFIEAFFRD